MLQKLFLLSLICISFLLNICAASNSFGSQYPITCAEIDLNREYDIFKLYTSKNLAAARKFYALCKIDPHGDASWTVIQKRKFPYYIGFDRSIKEYVEGFGNLKDEFFLGLDYINKITDNMLQQLRIDIEDTNGKSYSGVYDYFAIGSIDYPITILGDLINSTIPEVLSFHAGEKFSTFDRDFTHEYCAKKWNGGWWYQPYKDCNVTCNLNGRPEELLWETWPLSSVELSIRPRE